MLQKLQPSCEIGYSLPCENCEIEGGGKEMADHFIDIMITNYIADQLDEYLCFL